MILTDVLVTVPLPPHIRQEFAAIGLDYLFEATRDDFQNWMTAAGLINVEVIDLTSIVRGVWEYRRSLDLTVSHQTGYSYLLDDQKYSLGKAVFYIYVRGDKPKKPPIV